MLRSPEEMHIDALELNIAVAILVSQRENQKVESILEKLQPIPPHPIHIDCLREDAAKLFRLSEDNPFLHKALFSLLLLLAKYEPRNNQDTGFLQCPISLHEVQDPVLTIDGYQISGESPEVFLSLKTAHPVTRSPVSLLEQEYYEKCEVEISGRTHAAIWDAIHMKGRNTARRTITALGGLFGIAFGVFSLMIPHYLLNNLLEKNEDKGFGLLMLYLLSIGMHGAAGALIFRALGSCRLLLQLGCDALRARHEEADRQHLFADNLEEGMQYSKGLHERFFSAVPRDIANEEKVAFGEMTKDSTTPLSSIVVN
jgi:hypothetical protein